MWSSVLLGKCIFLCTIVMFVLVMKAVDSVGSLRSGDSTVRFILKNGFDRIRNTTFDKNSKTHNSSLTETKRSLFLKPNGTFMDDFSENASLFNTDNENSEHFTEAKSVFAGPSLPWYDEILKGLFLFVKQCQNQVDCYRKRILQGLDRLIEIKSVKVADGIFLVKEQEEDISLSRESENQEPFLLALSRRIIHILETHALRVRLGVMKEAVDQARLGPYRHYKHAFPMLVGSFMVLAAFLVPMGFQFLAVVGGKALVLSQIALVLAMGSSLQRYFGFGGPGGYRQGGVGYVQHDYYLRSDNHPPQWEGKHRLDQLTYPRQQPPHEPSYVNEPHTFNTQDHQVYLQQHLTQQQLQGLMNN